MSRKVLVLGSTGHPKEVTSYTWDSIPDGLNVANFDAVILNLASGTQDASVETARFPKPQQFASLLISEGTEVIVTGSPDKTFGRPPLLSYWWFPLIPLFVRENHQGIEDVAQEFAGYFRHVRSCGFHAVPELQPSGAKALFLEGLRLRMQDVGAAIEPIAKTRSGNYLAFRIVFSNLQNHTQKLNPVVWLPPVTEVPQEDAINLLLAERYGIAYETAAPAWLEGYKLPAQMPIEESIAAIEGELSRLGRELSLAQALLPEATKFRRLLYEQGDLLEDIVLEALALLGATVEGERKAREDGRLTDPQGRKAMLETKGLVGSIKGANLRELQQWVNDAVVEEDWEGKGILVANTFRNIPPSEREVADSIPNDCVRVAERFGHRILSTVQLFEAVCRKQRGEFDQEAFWDGLIEGTGICDLPFPGQAT